MVTATEALTSSDIKIVKKLRGSLKTQITVDANILEKALAEKTDNKFNFGKISLQLVKSQKAKLQEHFSLIQKLHDHYIELRDEGQNTEEEDNLVQQDTEYLEKVTSKVFPLLDEIERYEEGLTNLNTVKTLAKCESETKNSVLKAKAEFKLVHEKIKSELDSLESADLEKKGDITKTFPVESFISDLSTAYKDLREACTKFEDNALAMGREDGEPKVTTMNCAMERVLQLELDTRLKVVEQAKKLAGLHVTHSNHDSPTDKAAPLKINKPECLKFSGQARDFAPFKRDFLAIVAPNRDDAQIGIHLKQAIPEKHKHLISNKDLTDWRGMLSVVEEELANPKLIVDLIVNEIKRMKTATSDKGFIDFVESLERIERDLGTLNQLSEVANTSILSELEAKLPAQINHDWTKKVIKKKFTKKTSSEKFSYFMAFLKDAKDMTRYNIALPGNIGKNFCFVTGTALSQKQPEQVGSQGGNKKQSNTLPCLACNIDGATDLDTCLHNMGSCLVWGSLSYQERVNLVKCIKHPFSRDEHTTSDCKRSVRSCIHCQKENDHNSLLCPNFQVKKKGSSNLTRQASGGYINKLHDLAPTLLYTMFVKTNGGRELGALMDNGSTDDYILNSVAKRMNLKGQQVELVTEGFGGNETRITTNLYYLPIWDVDNRVHYLPCYGTDCITNECSLPDTASYQRMCQKFGVDPREVRRPKKIEVLISLRSGYLHPNHPNTLEINGMRLASGPLGRVFGGTSSDLKFNSMRIACPVTAAQIDSPTLCHSVAMKTIVRQATYTTPLRTDREILNFFDEEQIGVQCEPRCGDCRCGGCVYGSKQMSLKEEREYERFKSLMHLDISGTEDDPGPYWRTKFPWTVEPSDLIDNKKAVLAVMRSTLKKLEKNHEWRDIYEAQLKALVDKKFASEISERDIECWEAKGGKTYFIAHQMAVNPESKSTPVRCCFNSSQRYMGHSLNASWELGPDLVNSLHSVLLRFRKDLVAAQGDITKMYYMVRIEEEETWMQIFMWQFQGEDSIRYFKMNRLVMGNKPSASLSGVALSETARLDNVHTDYPAAFQALTRDAYVDNVFLTAANHDELKAKIAEIEYVASRGGFFFKPFIVSGEDSHEIMIGLTLPDAVSSNEEKALGVYWNVKEDTFYIKSNLTKVRKRVKRGVKAIDVSVSEQFLVTIAPHLTLRACLSLHATPFDALGLVLPTKVIGNILFRNTLQVIKKGNKGKIPWDDVIEGDLKEAWCQYFSMLSQLDSITFPRSFKPHGVDDSVKPDFITFNDGNPDAFGTVGYIRWTLMDGTRQCRLMLSKSRLGPLTHKGETVRNELSGATLTARLKHWVQRNSEVEFSSFYHFLDSQIVKDMLMKDSYGFNTFVGLRVAEVQQKTSVTDWRHIPSKFNMADVLTKGVHPNRLGPLSEWQNGPAWLRLDESNWPRCPRTTNEEPSSRDTLDQYLRKGKTFFQSSRQPDCIDELVSRCSNLNKLLRSTAFILRWLYSTRKVSPNLHHSEGIDVEILKDKVRPICATERMDAMDVLVAWNQKTYLTNKQAKSLVPKTITKKLVNYDIEVVHMVVAGRIKNFPVAFAGHSEDIPILPAGGLSKLIVKYYHNKYHREIDTIVTHVRNDYWVIKCRKIASIIDSQCVDCKISRKNMVGQVMGDLPEFRVDLQPAFSVVGCDLWGPIYIRDDVVKRGRYSTKKVWGVLLTCTATRAVYLDVACGASTEELLHVLRRAMARCGTIHTIVSDPGTNLIGAAREMNEWRSGWDQDMLLRFGAQKGIRWVTVMANSQHQNGISEAMIKVSKTVLRSLMKSMGSQVLTLNELNTLLAETSQLVNERPIGMKPNERVDSTYLSPNSLLLGRNSDRICSGPFLPRGQEWSEPSSFKDRFLLIQAITRQFWQNWMKLYFPSLVIRTKWHVDKRNLCKGDICVMRDNNALRGEWRLAKVSATYPDDKGKVRNVELLVKPKQGATGDYVPTAPTYVKRHVQNLILLVPVDEANDYPLNNGKTC